MLRINCIYSKAMVLLSILFYSISV